MTEILEGNISDSRVWQWYDRGGGNRLLETIRKVEQQENRVENGIVKQRGRLRGKQRR